MMPNIPKTVKYITLCTNKSITKMNRLGIILDVYDRKPFDSLKVPEKDIVKMVGDYELIL
jgi:hypothetical protein